MLIRIIGVFASFLCGYACYWAVRWSVADYAAKYPARARIEYALRLAPENPEYYVRLARADPAQALSAMQRATQLNPLGSSGWIELARAAEAHHDFQGAEQSLVRAVQLDKTFAPRWLLAEYYSRRHDEARFWPAVRAALAASYDDVTPLFDLCWNFAADPGAILDWAVPNRSDVTRQYLDFLLSKNRLDAADVVASRVMRDAGPEAVPDLLGYCDRLLPKNDSSRAVEVWNVLATKRLLRYPTLAVSQGRSLTNGAFHQPFLGRGFDWHLFPVNGVFGQYGGASGGVRFDFSGKQPENCELLAEWVPVEPARQYQFVIRYATAGLDRDTGLKWRVLDSTTDADLLSTGGWLTGNEVPDKKERYGFFTAAQTRLVRLVLFYQRLPGTVRIEGSLSLENAALGFGS